MDATKLKFNIGNCGVILPKQYDEYLLAPTNPALAMPPPPRLPPRPPLRPAAPPLHHPASVARREKAAAEARAAATTLPGRNSHAPTSPVRHNTTSGVQPPHPHQASSSSAQSARSVTNAGGVSADIRARHAAVRGSE